MFLDTVGVLALLDTRDQWHVAAETSWVRMLAYEMDFMTTPYVLAECANAATRRPYRAAVVRMRNSLTASAAVIVPTDEEWDSAWQNYSRGDAASAGVVDQLSFLVMRRFGCTRAFTNDRHFSAAGFEVLF